MARSTASRRPKAANSSRRNSGPQRGVRRSQPPCGALRGRWSPGKGRGGVRGPPGADKGRWCVCGPVSVPCAVLKPLRDDEAQPADVGVHPVGRQDREDGDTRWFRLTRSKPGPCQPSLLCLWAVPPGQEPGRTVGGQDAVIPERVPAAPIDGTSDLETSGK